ncbi:MAG: hypothetical protein MUE95_13780 [Cyclobacteriaceae bacterium]|nr:hypothetical protein [Cyclobacteriaceae bacterium]
MIREYHQQNTGSRFLLIADETNFGRTTTTANQEKFYTFAWNNGPAQYVMLDEVTYDFPNFIAWSITMKRLAVSGFCSMVFPHRCSSFPIQNPWLN